MQLFTVCSFVGHCIMRFSLTLKFLARMYWIEMPSPSWGEVVVIIHVTLCAHISILWFSSLHDHTVIIVTVCFPPISRQP